jgi:hypothetical protein
VKVNRSVWAGGCVDDSINWASGSLVSRKIMNMENISIIAPIAMIGFFDRGDFVGFSYMGIPPLR